MTFGNEFSKKWIRIVSPDQPSVLVRPRPERARPRIQVIESSFLGKNLLLLRRFAHAVETGEHSMDLGVHQGEIFLLEAYINDDFMIVPRRGRWGVDVCLVLDCRSNSSSKTDAIEWKSGKQDGCLDCTAFRSADGHTTP